MVTGAGAIVQAYFAGVRSRDVAALVALFADDGEIVGPGFAVRGREEIEAFLERTLLGDNPPEPHLGTLVVDGEHVAVELVNRAGGGAAQVADFFTVSGAHIARMSVYLRPS